MPKPIQRKVALELESGGSAQRDAEPDNPDRSQARDPKAPFPQPDPPRQNWTLS